MASLPERPIYLASRSPRRRELLAQIDVRFQLLLFRADPQADADVGETPLPGEAPAACALRLARAKAEAGWARVLARGLPLAPVLAADTLVALDGRIYGKPAERREAEAMLAALSGRWHEVYTAVAVKYGERLETALSVSEVEFAPLSPERLRAYVASGEGDDKAGAYALQGRAARFVRTLRGSPSGVAGLPLYETAELLERIAPPVAERRRGECSR